MLLGGILSLTAGAVGAGSQPSLKELSNAAISNWRKPDTVGGINAEGGGDSPEDTEKEGPKAQ